jgi:hypothetical protein
LAGVIARIIVTHGLLYLQKNTMTIQTIKKYSLWLCLLFIIALPAHAAAAQAVGHVGFSKGNNTAQLPGAAPRMLEKNTEVFQSDNIVTTTGSFAIIDFTDGSKVTVRPDSQFSIDSYNDQPENKTAKLILHKGQVNATTGEIAKLNPENFQIITPTATVKPQSGKAEFTVDICKSGCDKSQGTAANQQIKLEQNLVARVVDIKGEVNAVNRADKDAKERALSLGKPLYNSDFIRSKKDSWVLLVFPDGEKLTLQADSELDIKQYNYQISNKKDQVLFHLAKGGLRALSGSIAHNDHDAFALTTPVATIGIRGTETFTVVTQDPSDPSSMNMDHQTLQGLSVAMFTDNSGKTNETFIPAGSSFEMAASPQPTGTVTPDQQQPAGTPILPKVIINQAPTVKPTPPNAPQPQGPPLVPDPEGTKALFQVNTAPIVTIVKMVSGNAKIASKDGQNSATIKPGDTGSVKPNSDLLISAPINSTNSSTNNTNEPANTNQQTDANQTNNNQQTDNNNQSNNTQPNNTNTNTNTGNTTSNAATTNSEQQVTPVQQLTAPASPN